MDRVRRSCRLDRSSLELGCKRQELSPFHFLRLGPPAGSGAFGRLPRAQPEGGVPKRENDYVSKPRIGFPRGAANQERTRAAPEGQVEPELRRKEETNVCILSFNTSGGYDPGLLLVFVEDMGISVDVSVNDLEPGFVGDAISVSECGWTGIWVARHDMEWGEDKGGDGVAGVGRWGSRQPHK